MQIGVAVIANSEVRELVPMLLMAATLKLYVLPALNPVLVKEVSIWEATNCTQIPVPWSP